MKKRFHIKFLCFISFLVLIACVKQTKDIDEWSVQNRLDNGDAVGDILKGHQPHDFYARYYQGGLIFHLDKENGQGYIVSETNQSEGIIWGCDGNIAEASKVGDGATNTAEVVALCPGEHANQLCNNLDLNGYMDWFLPSKDEMEALVNNLPDSLALDLDLPYWTSTGNTFSSATIYNGFASISSFADRDSLYKVRAIRSFSF